MAEAIDAQPMSKITGPETKVRYRPTKTASANTSHIPRRMLWALSSPACTARVGPRRSEVSAPFSKSNTSLAKFAPICSSNAPASAASAGPHFTAPRADAQAVPTSTGTAAALSVFGRLASSHAPIELGRTSDFGMATIGAAALMFDSVRWSWLISSADHFGNQFRAFQQEVVTGSVCDE